METVWMVVLCWTLVMGICCGAPARVKQPAYVMKFVALFPHSKGPLAYCDYNTTPRSRNPCDFRVHFDVLFEDDQDKIPYADLQFILPNNQDYFIADPTDKHWLAPLPRPSYPGEAESLASDEYEQILLDDADDKRIILRITIFDRDDVGLDDLIAQEEYKYTLNDVLRHRERIQSKAVKCKPGLRCLAIQTKFMFYLLDDEYNSR